MVRYNKIGRILSIPPKVETGALFAGPRLLFSARTSNTPATR